jgi:cyclopropane-fatty-acyl-phospholipid synthase
MADSKKTVEELLKLIDVKVGGKRPFDIQVHDDRFYNRVLAQRDIGLGESYMDGWWDVKCMDQLFARILSSDLRKRVRLSLPLVRTVAAAALRNQQTVKRAQRNASYHYDIGNDLYERMLDKRMIYSCGYWAKAKTLNEAQEAKLDLVCHKLHLKKGMTLLDIGCGWGGFSEYAARKYGVKVTGITPAAEQVKVAKQRTKGLDVKIMKKDYRHMTGKFDRIVSIGMLEHVGPKNYKRFFGKCKKMLNDDGIMLHHTIGSLSSVNSISPWIDKYIFPGSVLPSLVQINRATGDELVIEDVHNFGPDYDKTLMAWHTNFVKHYPEISDKYDERFYRMWNFYLLSCAGGFRARNVQLWQIVMRKREISDTYVAVR